VVSFPPSRPGGTSAEQRVEQTTLQLAHILKITANFALRRIAEEYLDNPLLSLLGEADAAREYIDDRQHNRKGQRMTPAFFRRWLKREHEDALLRHARSTQATGTAGPEGDHSVTTHSGNHAAPATRNLMNLREQYAADVGRQAPMSSGNQRQGG